MIRTLRNVFGIAVLLWTSALWAGSITDRYADTMSLFRNAGESAAYFDHCYGYAVFPTIGKAAWAVGGAHGSGRVYVHGMYVGDASVNQLSVGFQAGGQAYSQVVFFEDRRAFDEFTRHGFEFGADVNAVAITAAAGGSVGTTGVDAGASGGMKDARTLGSYHRGLAVFTIVKGGAMFQAAVAAPPRARTHNHPVLRTCGPARVGVRRAGAGPGDRKGARAAPLPGASRRGYRSRSARPRAPAQWGRSLRRGSCRHSDRRRPR